ncbi:hypothetical protein CALVIDRAFT_537760 [Calocera viscosa TUFC12733]|uniref:cAMP-independent regulatory protein pac2 n=1 Tax=Calocera viscosa (strain TUFC12733) TaxID=1330018 RepID=A0A167LKG4_CALVF|nr:hypothetical protein CALVIDRAFT_537760 [Calocera viscosa TUFC12733]
MHLMFGTGAVDYRSRGPSVARAGVSSQHDALVIFEAARRGCIPVMRHRLADNEKDIHLMPGSVYVWEEAHASDRSSRCLRRWTDGVKWSQSRMREPFLFYEEVPPFERTEQDRRNRYANTPPSTSTLPSDAHGAAPRARHPSRRDRIIKQDGLKKLTFSALVCMDLADPQDKWAKWHLVCYMTGNDRTIPGVAELPKFAPIEVPDGVYFDTKGVPLDNAPRQTVRWPREPMMGPTPPPSDRDSTYSPMTQQHHMPNMPLAPMSPPASPEDCEDDRYARYHSGYVPASPYVPATPPHIATAPPAPRQGAYPTAPPAPYHNNVIRYSPYDASRPPHPRLPPVSELLTAHYPDLDNPNCGKYIQLPPPNPSAQWGWTRRASEDARYLHMVDDVSHLRVADRRW